MRPMMIVVCVSATACIGQGATPPTSPTRSTAPPAVSAPTLTARQSSLASAGPGPQSRVQLPFAGKFAGATAGVFNCPATCPPTTLRVSGTATGEATHLGRFTLATVDVIDLIADTGTGTWNFTAANGDALYTTTFGAAPEEIPPNISHVRITATIVGGSGRFAGATGTFTILLVQTIDLAANTASTSGSFEGYLTVPK